jgi:hypothetical protein
MGITTIKHCQIVPDYWFTVEDRDREQEDEIATLVITYYDEIHPDGERKLVVSEGDALLIRDAINQLFPVSNGH